MKLLNANEAAEHLHVSRTTFWKMRKDCPLPTVKAYRRIQLFDVDVLEKWFVNFDANANYRSS